MEEKYCYFFVCSFVYFFLIYYCHYKIKTLTKALKGFLLEKGKLRKKVIFVENKLSISNIFFLILHYFFKKERFLKF
jgi:hypothetical protein